MTRPFAAERKTAPQVGGCRPMQYEVKNRRGAATLQPAMSTPESLFKRHCGARLNREMLQVQLEVTTRVHTTQHGIRDELINLRNTATHAAAEHGLAILASGTHPP